MVVVVVVEVVCGGGGRSGRRSWVGEHSQSLTFGRGETTHRDHRREDHGADALRRHEDEASLVRSSVRVNEHRRRWQAGKTNKSQTACTLPVQRTVRCVRTRALTRARTRARTHATRTRTRTHARTAGGAAKDSGSRMDPPKMPTSRAHTTPTTKSLAVRTGAAALGSSFCGRPCVPPTGAEAKQSQWR
jgi:hypothetical protein